MEPIRPSDVLRKLSTITNRFLGGPERIDVVELMRSLLKGRHVYVDANFFHLYDFEVSRFL